MLILKLQRGGLLLDLAGHSVTFTKIECASNYMHFWDHVSHGARDRCIGRYISQYSTKYRWSIDRVLVGAWFNIGRYINRVSSNISTDTPIGRYSWHSPILHQ